MNYRQQLQRQLGFLRRSCESYDAGYEDEGIRLAVIIRTLLHDTRNSTSLLAHLNATSIELLSATPPIPSNTVFFGGGLSVARTQFSPNGVTTTYVPMLQGIPELCSFVPAKQWWEQDVYLLNEGRISRKQIVLGASNKDGGAHVDPKLTSEYEALVKGIFTVQTVSPTGEVQTYPVPNSHLSDLRQMSYELLNSPSLIVLAE